ncbi:fatty acid desaturase [Hymenobacter busanensis]|uniref:Fatty acid desaturase n=1 Tax=Hymenobacter busanensis TaxID=2607656 RepID=A0A7L5A087_9BACT|nr:fatty acid desaturase [Hymenobacter busanensis]KAA9339098.1 fatty acid desaturase [Hymenobacter busanensis]QHJ07140.1 fatty acid desaturase [Hymenobacter busanensis]
MQQISTATVSSKVRPEPLGYKGVAVAVAIVVCWAGLLTWLLAAYRPDWRTPWPYLLALLQTHLYTGLFITAHDAMHGVVSPNKRLNNALGTVAAGLFAYNWFPRLLPRHHAHHRHVATPHDPDFHDGQHPNFLLWLLRFARNYITIGQVVLMALTFNVLKLFFPTANVVAFWMLPAVLATIQLFYFGTYLPHRGEHDAANQHKSRSQGKQHLWAFVSCYFFGYHYEHHDQPYLPWWRLWRAKADGK